MFVLKVVVQAKPTCREMLPDHRHVEVRAAASAGLPGQGIAKMSRRIRPPPRLRQQRLPFGIGQAFTLPVSPGVFPAMIEEAGVIPFVLQRQYLLVDEMVELPKAGFQRRWQIEVHGGVFLHPAYPPQLAFGRHSNGSSEDCTCSINPHARASHCAG